MADDYVAKMREAAARAAKGAKFTPAMAARWAADREAKAARRREQNRVNKAAQRARDKAGIPASRPGPPRLTGTPGERAQKVRNIQRERRANVLSQLPDVRNPSETIRVGERTKGVIVDKKTPKAQARNAAAFREQAAAERLQAVGRSRKDQLRNELISGPQASRLTDNMTPEQRRRFQQLAERIAGAGSNQSTAILFNHAGGANAYHGALEKMLASPESRDVEEGLSQLEHLAQLAEKAGKLYAPSKIGRLTV